jgi:hypothetical protein
VDELPLHPGLVRFSTSSTSSFSETGEAVFMNGLLSRARRGRFSAL